MPIDDLPTLDLLIMVAAFFASGLVRGFTGGAGANFFNAPVLSILIGPREAVPIVLLLNAVTNVQLIPGAVRHVRWREALPIAIAAALTMPLGAWALFVIDEVVMRRLIAGVAVGFAGSGTSLELGGVGQFDLGMVSSGLSEIIDYQKEP
jgi:uncharacterized membrane protein YfcA